MKFCTSLVLMAFLLSSALFTSSCAKKESQAKVSFQFQSKTNGAFANEVEVVLVNVSGPGISSVVFKEFDCENGECENISIEVQSGPQRLIQLLVVTKGSDDVGIVNYSDVTTDLTNGSNTVSIAVSPIGSFNTEARLMGRYIPSSAHPLNSQLLTGWIDMSVAVGIGKPDMKISTFEIFGGWFNTFILDGVPFKYTFRGYNSVGTQIPEQPIFNDLHDIEGLDLQSAGIQSNSNKIVHFTSSVDVYEEDNGSFSNNGRPFRSKIIGFFGGPQTRSFCSKSLNPATVFNGNDGRSRICKAVSGTVCSDYATLSDISISSVSVNGSVDSCAADTTAMAVNLERMDDDKEDFLEYVGPFSKESLGFENIFKYDGVAQTVSWEISSGTYLPAGVEVFFRNLASDFNEDAVESRDDGILCENLSNEGFVSLGVSTATPGVVAGVSPSMIANPNFKLVLCPVTPKGEYYRTAFFLRGGNQGPPPVVEFELHEALATVMPGYEFGGSQWGSNEHAPMQPQDNSTINELFVTIRNLTSESVNVSDIHVNFFDGFGIDTNPASTPSSRPQCLSTTPTLTARGTANDNCVVRITFDPTSPTVYSPASTIYNALSVSAEISGSSNPVHSSIPFLAPIYVEVLYSAGAAGVVDFYAQPGEKDVKFVKFTNDSGGPNWTLTSVPGQYGDFSFDGCSAAIPNGNACIAKVEIDNTGGGGLTDGSNNGAGLPVGGTPAKSIVFNIYANGPSLDLGNPYNYGLVTAALNPTFTLNNNSSAILNTQNSNPPNSPFALSNDTCLANSVSTTCNFDMGVPASQPSGTYREQLYFPYEIGQTFRVYTLELEASYQ